MADVKKEWLKAEIEELIIMYQGKPVLWDVTSNIYKNRVKKQDAYQEMAEEFNTTIEEIQRKIHNLRNQFNSEFKKSKKKNNPARDATENNTPSDNQGIITLEQSAEENRSDATPKSQNNEPNPRKKRKIEVCDKNKLIMQKAIHALYEEDDVYDVFGKYVASEMRSLSSEYLRKKMKRQFQEVILRINEEDELLSSPTSHHSYSNPYSVASVRGYVGSPEHSAHYTTLLQSSDTLAQGSVTLSSIGRGTGQDLVLFAWPPRSPDLTPCDFYLWGDIKDMVYIPPLPPTLGQLRDRITTVINNINRYKLQRVWAELDYRLDICRVT
ncbi:uncharacterized protein LOC116160947 [Photinus pyralis]|uniref:uncharacterized protein LOC116160947 n=1 Tax=Photinus pyralis TaxID=7054 RepID=UPI001266E7A8|nr:uncharacterized protein LOC116160947 [Photinus pyralis]